MDQWAEVKAMIAGSEQVLSTQMLVMALLEADKAVEQDGHTFYFPLARIKPEFMRKVEPSERVEAIWEDYLTGLYRKVQRREYDYILVTMWEMRGMFGVNPPPFSKLGGKEFLARHYHKTRTIPLSMTPRRGGGQYGLQVWEPKPRRAKRARSNND